MTAERVALAPAAAVDVSYDGGTARITVTGSLSSAAADRLGQVCDRVLRDRPSRIELDLSAVTGAGDDGAAAVARCLWLGRLLENGVEVTVLSDAGREVLLASLASV